MIGAVAKKLPPAMARSAAFGAALVCLALAGADPVRAWMDNDPDAYVVNYYTGGGADGVLFAAGTANQQCTSLGPAAISVIRTSPGVQLTVQPGAFAVTGTDYGYLVCLGKMVQGTLVTGTGTGEATIRVTYPPLGQWYEHILVLSGR
ncbi:hypothetical protein [Aquabacter spiritensis]|uniref:Uncharacterized protein n=1 Tax=Aquabacter spiritensis TaxID=933073 RepID=A0A4R3M3H8_9HYPH|nr:hypothetical protein [Aquabacter spiritensis]TCT07572.1 hypothetical protein EDC64_10191 [Aquabacter spiritensis]